MLLSILELPVQETPELHLCFTGSAFPRNHCSCGPPCTTISGVSSSCYHLSGSFLYLLANCHQSLYRCCLSLVSVKVWSSFHYLILPVEPRMLIQFNLTITFQYAGNHARHEETMLFAAKELTIEWCFSSFYIMHPLSHNWKGKVSIAPLPTLLHKDSSPSLIVMWLESCFTFLNCSQSMTQPIGSSSVGPNGPHCVNILLL